MNKIVLTLWMLTSVFLLACEEDELASGLSAPTLEARGI